MDPKQTKRQWTEPKVVVFGDVESLTLANNKTFGTGDSITFQGQPTRLSG